MVLAGIERSPKIFDFRASGIPVQKRVDFFDTLKRQGLGLAVFVQSVILLVRVMNMLTAKRACLSAIFVLLLR